MSRSLTASVWLASSNWNCVWAPSEKVWAWNAIRLVQVLKRWENVAVAQCARVQAVVWRFPFGSSLVTLPVRLCRCWKYVLLSSLDIQVFRAWTEKLRRASPLCRSKDIFPRMELKFCSRTINYSRLNKRTLRQMLTVQYLAKTMFNFSSRSNLSKFGLRIVWWGAVPQKTPFLFSCRMNCRICPFKYPPNKINFQAKIL